MVMMNLMTARMFVPFAVNNLILPTCQLVMVWVVEFHLKFSGRLVASLAVLHLLFNLQTSDSGGWTMIPTKYG